MGFRSLLDDGGDRRTNETWSTGREMAYGYDDAHQLTEVDAARPSDEARYAYDPAGNPVERAELGFETTNAFNNLNQILSGSWTGSTITAVGAVNYLAGTVTVGGASGTIYSDKGIVGTDPINSQTTSLGIPFDIANWDFKVTATGNSAGGLTFTHP